MSSVSEMLSWQSRDTGVSPTPPTTCLGARGRAGVATGGGGGLKGRGSPGHPRFWGEDGVETVRRAG